MREFFSNPENLITLLPLSILIAGIITVLKWDKIIEYLRRKIKEEREVNNNEPD